MRARRSPGQAGKYLSGMNSSTLAAGTGSFGLLSERVIFRCALCLDPADVIAFAFAAAGCPALQRGQRDASHEQPIRIV